MIISGVQTMSVFDRFKSKANLPKGYSEVKFEFTEEESEAINQTLEGYAAIANADTPDGMRTVVATKVKEVWKAQGLTEYVEDLMLRLQRCESDEEMALLLDKAIKAQMKAYAIHNLPIYLFQLAGMFELAGDATNAKDFFRHFLQAQSAFKPDQLDTIVQDQTGFDMPKVIEIAKQKAR
jgi:hypothetical protein